jgi:hypothetical protein
VAPAGASAQGGDPAAPATTAPPDPARRQALEARVAELSQQIAALEEQVPQKQQAVNDAAAKVASIDQDLGANKEAIDQSVAARDLPARARVEFAVSLYVRGDPKARTLTDFFRDGELRTDDLRQEVLFQTAEEGARRRVEDIDAETARLYASRAEMERLRAETVAAQQAAEADLGKARADLGTARGELDSVKDELKSVLQASQRAPLTGAVDYPIRPAIGIKIDNSPDGRPQSGINLADVVYEEIVEGGITRFLAMFQSVDADRVGPVRSARTSDIDLLSGFNTPILGFSGANDGVLDAIAVAPIVPMNESNTGSAFFRDEGRDAPHNLYTRTASLYEAEPGQAGMPASQFTFRPAGQPPTGGQATTGVRVSVGNDSVTYTWNGTGWARLTNGSPHRDSDGEQVTPDNVIVQYTNYAVSPADANSPEAVTVGTGDAWVFTGGQVVQGHWARANSQAPVQYLDAANNPIALTPGRTWIALPRPGSGALL